jgi:aryl-alcohol dehydrogenase-like predicted oxidoreductase
MEQLRLGDSGLQVSRIILGCMSYGDASRGGHAWTLGLEESRPFYRQAWEAGITTFDTANVYSLGSSEEFLRILMGEIAKRDEYVIATKVHGHMFDGPKGSGLSRAAILTSIDDSLRRLGTDYVDLYQIHRWDPEVPIEETMEASSMWAWQFAQAQHVADLNGWTRFVSMQDQYSLLYREEEREMHPYCLDQGVGVIPWSPIARGRLARPWGEDTDRSRTDKVLANNYKQQVESDRMVVETVGEIATERGVPRAQVAYAWVLHQSAVTAPIAGATKPGQLDDAIAAVDIELTADELRRLEEHYAPRNAEGF